MGKLATVTLVLTPVPSRDHCDRYSCNELEAWSLGTLYEGEPGNERMDGKWCRRHAIELVTERLTAWDMARLGGRAGGA